MRLVCILDIFDIVYVVLVKFCVLIFRFFWIDLDVEYRDVILYVIIDVFMIVDLVDLVVIVRILLGEDMIVVVNQEV